MAISYYHLGFVRLRQKRYPEAKKFFELAIGYNPGLCQSSLQHWNFPKTRILNCLAQIKDQKAKAKLLEKLREINPGLAKKVKISK